MSRTRLQCHQNPLWVQTFVCILACLYFFSGCPPDSQAQERLGVAPPRRPGPVEPSFPKSQAPPLSEPVLPTVPTVPSRDKAHVPGPRIFVRRIQISGSTVFSQTELAALTEPYTDRYVSSDELEELRRALTQLYIDKGYINSGAILPDQTVVNGVVHFHIIEGDLTEVTITGLRWFREGYIRKRVTLGVERPLNIGTLQTRLQFLQRDSRIERLHAELRPGVRLGESELQVRVEEYVPFFVALEFNNYQSPTVGEKRGLITLAHRNVTGHGDIFNVTFGRSPGLKLQIDTSYTLPLNAYDTTVSFRYRRNQSSVIEDQFADLNIGSRSEVFTHTLRHTLYRTLQREFSLSLSVERLESKTFLLDEPFSFSLGADKGEARDTALRLSLEWLDHTLTQVVAMRSRFSLGIDALGATINDDPDLPDGRFFAWLGQFQWAKRLGVQDIQLLFRLDVQLTTEPLLPLEQIAIGGRFSVRGYQENQLVRDNGLIVSLESRIPLIRSKRWAEFVQVIPFVDFGRGWNRQVPTLDPKTLVSIGLGLRWAATLVPALPLRSQLEVFWGYKLKDVNTGGGSLQDKGVHLQVALAAF